MQRRPRIEHEREDAQHRPAAVMIGDEAHRLDHILLRLKGIADEVMVFRSNAVLLEEGNGFSHPLQRRRALVNVLQRILAGAFDAHADQLDWQSGQRRDLALGDSVGESIQLQRQPNLFVVSGGELLKFFLAPHQKQVVHEVDRPNARKTRPGFSQFGQHILDRAQPRPLSAALMQNLQAGVVAERAVKRAAAAGLDAQGIQGAAQVFRARRHEPVLGGDPLRGQVPIREGKAVQVLLERRQPVAHDFAVAEGRAGAEGQARHRERITAAFQARRQFSQRVLPLTDANRVCNR